MTVKKVGEVEEHSHVESLPNRAELLHEYVVQARKVMIAERSYDWLRERDRTSEDRCVAACIRSLKQNFGEDVEPTLEIVIISCSEMAFNECALNFTQGPGQFHACPTTPICPAYQS